MQGLPLKTKKKSIFCFRPAFFGVHPHFKETGPPMAAIGHEMGKNGQKIASKKSLA
jgi:hypothetical protein